MWKVLAAFATEKATLSMHLPSAQKTYSYISLNASSGSVRTSCKYFKTAMLSLHSKHTAFPDTSIKMISITTLAGTPYIHCLLCFSLKNTFLRNFQLATICKCDLFVSLSVTVCPRAVVIYRCLQNKCPTSGGSSIITQRKVFIGLLIWITNTRFKTLPLQILYMIWTWFHRPYWIKSRAAYGPRAGLFPGLV
jgi:hypothetical protein